MISELPHLFYTVLGIEPRPQACEANTALRSNGKKRRKRRGVWCKKGVFSCRIISSMNHEVDTVLSNTQVLMFMF